MPNSTTTMLDKLKAITSCKNESKNGQSTKSADTEKLDLSLAESNEMKNLIENCLKPKNKPKLSPFD